MGTFRPGDDDRLTGSLDASGQIVDWTCEIWSNSHNQRIENAGRLMPTWSLAAPMTPAPPKEIPMPEGGGDRNSVPIYRVPNLHVHEHFLLDMPIRGSAMRSLGAYLNVFAIESFIDELAAEAQLDPVEFRLRHLDDPRARDVIQKASTRFGWAAARAVARRPDHGVGFAFAKYKNLMAYCAIAMEVTVERNSGAVSVDRVACAVDCGQIVNPDGAPHGITSFDWSTYPILRFSSVPGRIDVDLIDRPGTPFLGVGEASQGPAAAALANAVADATGKRVRDLPLAGDPLRS